MEKGLQRWLRPDGLALIAGWRRWGADVKEVARKMGVSWVQLKKWGDVHEEIGQALAIDAEAADFLVEEVVFAKALEGEQKALELWLKHRSALLGAGRDGGVKGVDYVSLAELINRDE